MKKEVHYITTAVLAFLLLFCFSFSGFADESAADKSTAGSSSDETLYTSKSSSASEEDGKETKEKESLLSITMLVAGHHGSDSSSCETFLKEASPEIVFISCGKENAYGHPSETTMKLLQKNDYKMYRTDLQGEVSVFSDTETYLVSVLPCQDFSSGKKAEADSLTEEKNNEASETETQEKSDSKKTPVPIPVVTAAPAPEPTPQPTPAPQKSSERTYILNTNSYKFHYPGCGSVSKMKDKNKLEYTGTREEIIGMGYSPCGNCHP